MLFRSNDTATTEIYTTTDTLSLHDALPFSPALALNLRWLYLSSVAGGVLIVVYGLVALGDVFGRGGPWGRPSGEHR